MDYQTSVTRAVNSRLHQINQSHENPQIKHLQVDELKHNASLVGNYIKGYAKRSSDAMEATAATNRKLKQQIYESQRMLSELSAENRKLKRKMRLMAGARDPDDIDYYNKYF